MRALASGAALVGALAVCGACVEPSEVPASATGDAQISSAAAPQAPAVVIEPGELAVAVERATAVGERDGSSATWPGRRDLAALYAPGAVIWLDPQGRPTNDARLAIGFLTGAATHGLAPAHYQASAIEARATALDDRATSPSVRAAFDVDLSRNLLRYWRDLHMGRVDPRTVGFRMDGPVDDHDFPAMLREALASRRLREATDALQPPLVLYRSLIQALARYRELAASQPPLSLAAPARSVKPGEQYDELHALGARLEALGDLAARQSAPPLAGVYEGPIVEAVERFQRRHGLESDGVLGRVTIAALDVPLDVRVHQLELALERLRWLPHPGERGFLAVNIPMFHLWGWDRLGDDGVPTFGMDVIVGRALNTQTPVFVEQMRHVIFRPYWNVPPSILRGEVLPAIARDPAYLGKQNMEIVDGPGDDARAVVQSEESLALLRQGRLRVRQRPGPKNSLGLVKFVFPNDDNIYMHGTPAPYLFSRPRRDFSHGCVRVSDPVRLAQWVLRDQPEWTRDRILRAMQGATPQRVDLLFPVPVMLFYLTAVVMPEDGSVHFADDIYGHDRRLAQALAGR